MFGGQIPAFHFLAFGLWLAGGLVVFFGGVFDTKEVKDVLVFEGL